MERIKIKKSQLKTVAKYLYRPSAHGTFEKFLIDLIQTFDFEVYERPEPKFRSINKAPEFKEPRPDSKIYRSPVIHRGTPQTKTLCGTNGLDVITTQEDRFVTCKTCILPKNQRKLAEKNSQDSED